MPRSQTQLPPGFFIASRFLWRHNSSLTNVQALNTSIAYIAYTVDSAAHFTVEMGSSGQISFIDDPRDSRKKLISKENVEQVVQALTPGL